MNNETELKMLYEQKQQEVEQTGIFIAAPRIVSQTIGSIHDLIPRQSRELAELELPRRLSVEEMNLKKKILYRDWQEAGFDIQEQQKIDQVFTFAVIEKQFMYERKRMAEAEENPKNKTEQPGPDHYNALKQVRSKVAPLLCGNVGSGKTELTRFIARHIGIRMFGAETLMDILYDKQGRYDEPPFVWKDEDLIIDDLGCEKEENIFGNNCDLARFLISRHEMYLKYGTMTCFTTNLIQNDLCKRYGERIFSRLAEMTYLVNIKTPDRRLARKSNTP